MSEQLPKQFGKSGADFPHFCDEDGSTFTWCEGHLTKVGLSGCESQISHSVHDPPAFSPYSAEIAALNFPDRSTAAEVGDCNSCINCGVNLGDNKGLYCRQCSGGGSDPKNKFKQNFSTNQPLNPFKNSSSTPPSKAAKTWKRKAHILPIELIEFPTFSTKDVRNAIDLWCHLDIIASELKDNTVCELAHSSNSLNNARVETKNKVRSEKEAVREAAISGLKEKTTIGTGVVEVEKTTEFIDTNKSDCKGVNSSNSLKSISKFDGSDFNRKSTARKKTSPKKAAKKKATAKKVVKKKAAPKIKTTPNGAVIRIASSPSGFNEVMVFTTAKKAVKSIHAKKKVAKKKEAPKKAAKKKSSAKKNITPCEAIVWISGPPSGCGDVMAYTAAKKIPAKQKVAKKKAVGKKAVVKMTCSLIESVNAFGFMVNNDHVNKKALAKKKAAMKAPFKNKAVPKKAVVMIVGSPAGYGNATSYMDHSKQGAKKLSTNNNSASQIAAIKLAGSSLQMQFAGEFTTTIRNADFKKVLAMKKTKSQKFVNRNAARCALPLKWKHARR